MNDREIILAGMEEGRVRQSDLADPEFDAGGIRLSGEVSWKSHKPGGILTAAGKVKNTITTLGKSLLVRFALWNISRSGYFWAFGINSSMVSTGTTAPKASDFDMDNKDQDVFIPANESPTHGGGLVGVSPNYTGLKKAMFAAAVGSGLVDGRQYAEIGLICGGSILSSGAAQWNIPVGQRIAVPTDSPGNLRWNNEPMSTYPQSIALFSRAVWPVGSRPTKQAGESLTFNWQINVL